MKNAFINHQSVLSEGEILGRYTNPSACGLMQALQTNSNLHNAELSISHKHVEHLMFTGFTISCPADGSSILIHFWIRLKEKMKVESHIKYCNYNGLSLSNILTAPKSIV